MAEERPAGVVTFLFTDIEGSTRLWERDAAVMRAVVSRHDAILGAAVDAAGGVVFKHVGDAVQAAFADPVAAVHAVADGQRRIAAERWEETGPLRVRMALHLGEATPNAAGDYNQIACLNRLSRLLSTGFGGQVLVTNAVRAAVGDHLPDGAAWRDLGRHRLRDLLDPEQVWQLDLAGLPDTFPPLRSLEGFPTNLPAQADALLGRERDLAAIHAVLAGEDARPLLTLIGPGGAGKTRLALQAAADALDAFPDGVFLVRLGEVTDPEMVLPAIAGTLGVREGGGLDQEESLTGYLAGKRLLLVLDNVEQVAAADPAVARLLDRCPQARVLATSRVPLRIAAERLHEVGMLPVPGERDGAEAIAASPAVQVFTRRAAARSPGFVLDAGNARTIAAIARRLDGLPLALELAAAQARHLSPREILAELDDRFGLLRGGDVAALPHQETLAATIRWSTDRLSPEERAAFERLSVFASGWETGAARRVIPGPGEDSARIDRLVRALADASLARRDADGRWSMLESINRFAGEALAASPEREALEGRFTAWAARLASEESDRLQGPGQVEALARLGTEHGNTAAALDLLARSGPERDQVAMTLALSRYWRIRGHLTEGRTRLRAALAATGITPEERLRCLIALGQFAMVQGDHTEAAALFEKGLDLARETGDAGRETALQINLGALALGAGDLREAEERFAAALALAEARGDAHRRLDALANLGALAHHRGDMNAALARNTECLRGHEAAGDLRGAAEMAVNLLYLLAPLPAHRARARAFGDEALQRMSALGDRSGMGAALTGLGWIEEAEGDPHAAAARHLEALALFVEAGDRGNEARALGHAGLASVASGRRAEGMDHLREALRLSRDLGEPAGVVAALEALAWAGAGENPAAA
ncbi:MAG: ATP-binding protein, partial [Thermomicrobiales bacterium]